MDFPDRDRAGGDAPDTVALPDHYAALQVQASASQQEIRRAYRALMRNLHPDVDGGRPAAGGAGTHDPAQKDSVQKTELLRIMQAFAVLSDPGRRAAYDQHIAERQAVSRPETGPQSIPVRYVRSRESRPRHTIRITTVRWESGPWA